MSDNLKNTTTNLNDGAVEDRRALIDGLFREHNQALIGFLRARLPTDQEARDVAQEAYVKLLQLDRPEELSFLRAYLYKTAANLAIDHLRRQKVRDRYAENKPLFDLSAPPTQQRELEGRQDIDIIKKAVAELPPACREAFLLSRFSGWPSGRIADRPFRPRRDIRPWTDRKPRRVFADDAP